MTINLMVPHLDLAPSYNYYFRSGKNAWHIDADLHYNFDVAPLVELYPLGGVSYYYCGKGYAGLNLGAGVTYNFAPEWALKSELKYQFVKHWDDLYVSIGVAYRLRLIDLLIYIIEDCGLVIGMKPGNFLIPFEPSHLFTRINTCILLDFFDSKG